MVSPLCICAPVSEAGLSALLETSAGGEGSYRDTHPWLVAQRLWQASDLPMPLILAVDDRLSHYGLLSAIDVEELHRGSWISRARFSVLQPMHPVWESLDSLMLWPAAEQLERETLEGIKQHRTALSVMTLHPYALCETPGFIGR